MKKIIVSDSSTLILVQKIGLLGKLARRFKFMMPEKVYQEVVVEGKHRKTSDAYHLEEEIRKKRLIVAKVNDKAKAENIANEFGIGPGEAEALALFFQVYASIVATDDHKAINACKAFKVPFITALTFVVEAHHNRIIVGETAKEMITLLGVYGRYKDELLIKALSIVEGKA